MFFGVVTLFPDMFAAVSAHGVTGRAVSSGLVRVLLVSPRDFCQDKHRSVDDRPYGGGPGMVGMVQPWREAIRHARGRLEKELGTPVKTIYLSPQGIPLTQAKVRTTAEQHQGLILLAGRYEGLDERVVQSEVDEEWSIGDYVLSGGELAAMVVMDAVIRQLPGVLGDADSALTDSFSAGLLDHPHYTRPEVIDNMAVPDVLLSGDHQAIAAWRQQQALGYTWLKRPDLLDEKVLTKEQADLLAAFQRDHRNCQAKT